jgi:enoyl-CoA hydratase/carnithine racemase
VETVEYAVEDGVAHITLARPASLNALSKQLGRDISEAFTEAEADPSARAVVLSGQGRSFCAGADLKDPETHSAVDIVGQLVSQRGGTSDVAAASCTKPVVCAVQGWSVGAGVEMVLAADVTIGDETAKFFLPQVSLGILPGAGGVARLVRAVGPAWASRMILLGDKVDAETALRIGLISEITPAGAHLERAAETARALAALPEASVRLAKQAVVTAADMPLHHALVADNYKLFVLSGTPEKQEAHAAFSRDRH